jgi:hydrogenase maturation protease
MTGRTLVAGLGNVFLGDDGFGVEVAARLSRQALPSGVRVMDIGTRARHLAYELIDGGYTTAILVDATARGESPGTIYLIEPERTGGAIGPVLSPADGHTMTPDAVLALIEALGGSPARILVLGCEPESIDERMGLSPVVDAAVDEALVVLRELLDDPLDGAVLARGRGTSDEAEES